MIYSKCIKRWLISLQFTFLKSPKRSKLYNSNFSNEVMVKVKDHSNVELCLSLKVRMAFGKMRETSQHV